MVRDITSVRWALDRPLTLPVFKTTLHSGRNWWYTDVLSRDYQLLVGLTLPVHGGRDRC